MFNGVNINKLKWFLILSASLIVLEPIISTVVDIYIYLTPEYWYDEEEAKISWLYDNIILSDIIILGG